MASNGGDNQHYSSDNNQQQYHQNQRRRLNDYPLHTYEHQTSFNGDIMGYLFSGSNDKNLTQEQAQYQAHYGEVHLQTNYKNSVTEVGQSSNRFIVNQQVEESPIGLSLSNLTPLVNQSQLGLTQPSNRQKRKKELIASEESKLKAASFFASSIQIGYWVKESKNEGDVVVKFYYGKKKLVWEFLYGSLKKKMEIRWSQVSAIKTFDDEHQNGYIALELSEPPELSEEVNFTAKKHTKWQTTRDDFTGGQASIYRRHTVKCPPGVLYKPFSDLLSSNSYLHNLSKQPFPRHSPPFHNLNGQLVYSAKQCMYASALIPVTNHGNHQGEFIDYVPNVVQPSSCFVGTVYPSIPSPVLNQIATRELYETPGTNGVTPPALNQIATRDSYETSETNGVYTPALSQITKRESYENAGKNSLYTPALNQTATRDLFETPGINGVIPQSLNQITMGDDEDSIDRDLQSLIKDLENENLPEDTNEQTVLNDQSYLMNLNTDHQSFEDNSKLPVGVVIPMVDSSIGGSQATNNLECLDEHDIALLQSFTNVDDLRNCVDKENGKDFEDAFKTSDGNVFPSEPRMDD